MARRSLMLVCLTFGIAAGAQAEGNQEKSIYQGAMENRVNAIASIQPGLGVVMHEMGYRLTSAYWAANGGNWGLAQYELKELLEAQEVAEITRPQRASMLKAFEDGYLAPLGKTIEKKDISQFNLRFSETVNGCNACHTALGYGFIRYHLPKQSTQEFLSFTVKTEPKYEEGKEPK
jgi:hypothetical protein